MAKSIGFFDGFGDSFRDDGLSATVGNRLTVPVWRDFCHAEDVVASRHKGKHVGSWSGGPVTTSYDIYTFPSRADRSVFVEEMLNAITKLPHKAGKAAVLAGTVSQCG